MRRTIGLKLTAKEERIVNQLNKGGVTNSELLRDALWFYFRSLTQSVEPLQDKKVNEADTVNFMIKNYVGHLKDEMSQLHEQDGRFQEYVKAELASLHSRMSQINKDFETKMQNPYDETESLIHIHNRIDEVIKKRTI